MKGEKIKIVDLEKTSLSEYEVEDYVPVSINSNTKKIVDITLTSVNDIEDKELRTTSIDEGTPIIDTSVFS